jgi:hypothetical protein
MAKPSQQKPPSTEIEVARISRSQAIWVAVIALLGGGIGTHLLQTVLPGPGRPPASSECRVESKLVGGLKGRHELMAERSVALGKAAQAYGSDKAETNAKALKFAGEQYQGANRELRSLIERLEAQCR